MDANERGAAYIEGLFSDDYEAPEVAGVAPTDAADTPCPCNGRGCDLCVDEARERKHFGHTPFADKRWQQRQRAKYGRAYDEPRIDEGAE